MAAPVIGRSGYAVASVGVIAVRGSFPDRAETARVVLAAATAISAALGAPPSSGSR